MSPGKTVANDQWGRQTMTAQNMYARIAAALLTLAAAAVLPVALQLDAAAPAAHVSSVAAAAAPGDTDWP